MRLDFPLRPVNRDKKDEERIFTSQVGLYYVTRAAMYDTKGVRVALLQIPAG